MNYFYFQQFLLDLIESKYVIDYKKGKEEAISKIKTVLPANTLVGGVGVGGAFRALANDLKKKVYEVEHS